MTPQLLQSRHLANSGVFLFYYLSKKKYILFFNCIQRQHVFNTPLLSSHLAMSAAALLSETNAVTWCQATALHLPFYEPHLQPGHPLRGYWVPRCGNHYCHFLIPAMLTFANPFGKWHQATEAKTPLKIITTRVCGVKLIFEMVGDRSVMVIRHFTNFINGINLSTIVTNSCAASTNFLHWNYWGFFLQLVWTIPDSLI